MWAKHAYAAEEVALELAAFSQSSTDTMVALQKKQSLLFIRCWLMQALQREGEGEREGVACVSLMLLPPHPPPASCAHVAHLLARLVATGLEHSRDGVSIADGAEVLLTGGLQGAECRWAGVGCPDQWMHTVPM